MPDSQVLIRPYWVQFNSVAEGEEGTNLAFPFLVVHQDEGDHLSGWVFAHDERNTAGLTDGVNWRAQIGRGAPGDDGSWSDLQAP